jgi:hypothetical protein
VENKNTPDMYMNSDLHEIIGCYQLSTISVIFVTRLHRMGQCKAKLNRKTMLMAEEVVVNMYGMVRSPDSRAENLLIGEYQRTED